MKLLFPLIFFYVISCSDKKPILKLLPKDFPTWKRLEMSKSTPDFWFQSFGCESIFGINKDLGIVSKVDLEGNKFDSICYFNTKNIEGITFSKKRNAFIVLANDSLIEYSFTGILKNKWFLGKRLNGFPYMGNPNGFNLEAVDDIVYIYYFFDDVNSYKSKKFFKAPIEIAFNMNTSKFMLLPSSYPEEYKTRCFGLQFLPDRVIDELNNHTFTFSYNDSAFMYRKGILEKHFFASARKVQKFSLDFEKVHLLNDAIYNQFLHTVSYYNGTQYFPFSKVYMRRFVNQYKNQKQPEVSFVVYSSSFKYYAETRYRNYNGGLIFDSPKHGPLFIIVNGNQLCFCKTNWHRLK